MYYYFHWTGERELFFCALSLQYRCDGNGVTTLLEEHAYSSQVSLLRFRKDNLYIAKANEVCCIVDMVAY